MKRYFTLLFFVSLFLTSQSANAIVIFRNYTYFERGGKVYYGDESHMDEAYLMYQASMASLEMLGSRYAKDNRWVYYEGKVVDGAHPASFQHLGYGYAKDRNRVFYKSKAVKGANLRTFEVVTAIKSSGYGKDKNHIFYDGRATSFDVNSFKVINDRYVADSSGIYIHPLSWTDQTKRILEGANPNDYKIIDNFIISAGKVFLVTKDLNMDAASFELLDKYEEHWHGRHSTYDYLVKDKDRILLANNGHEFDVETFKILQKQLVADKTGVYYYDIRNYSNYLRKLDLDPQYVRSYLVDESYEYHFRVEDLENGYDIDINSNYCSRYNN